MENWEVIKVCVRVPKPKEEKVNPNRKEEVWVL